MLEQTQTTYPLVLTDLRQMRCVIIGGGSVAERKAAGLIAGGALPLVISPTLTDGLAGWLGEGRITHVRRHYAEGDLNGAFLVIAATSDPLVNAEIAAAGMRQNMLVNIADDPDAGNFHTVATVRRGDLLLTVSTSGASPSLAAQIRRELAERYGEEYGWLLVFLRSLRSIARREPKRSAQHATNRE